MGVKKNLSEAVENKTLLDKIREITGYRGAAKTRLFLSELGYCTRFSDPRITEGLNAFLTINGYQKQIDHLVISGGLLPEFPPFYSVGNAERMRLLGVDPDKKSEPTSPRVDQQLFEYVLGSKDAAKFSEYREKWLMGKMNTWEDCKTFSSRQLETLLEGLDIPKIDYCLGDEDRFNMKYEEELKVNRMAKLAREYIKSLKEQREEIKTKWNEYSRQKNYEQGKLDKLEKELDVLKDINRGLASHLRSKTPNVPNFLRNSIAQKEDSFFHDLTTSQRRELLRRLREVKDEASFTALYQDKDKAVKMSRNKHEEAVAELAKVEEKLKPLDVNISAIERQLEQGDAITIFTKRASISPIEAEWLYKSVKDQYIEDLFSCFPEKIRKCLTTHISGSAKLSNVVYGPEKEDVLEEADLELVGGKVLVMHNTSFLSNTTSINGLSEAQREILFRKVLEKIVVETKGLVPETVVIAHGAGGLEITRISASPEFRAIDGTYREDPVMTTIITLPTMHSTDNLLRFYDKRMNKNWGTKRFAKKIHGTGATIETVLEDGSVIPFTIDTSSLIKIAEQKKLMEKQTPGSKDYLAEQKKLQQMCLIMPKSRAMIVDAHIGAANFAGTPTNYERLNRTINYLAANYNGKLDELILSELPDGVLTHTGSDRKFMGTPLPQLREEITARIEKIRAEKEGKELGREDYAAALEYAISRFTDSMAQNAIANLDQQYEAARPYIKSLAEKVSPAQMTLISGNHPRSQEGADEGKRLAGIVREYDPERKIKIMVSDAIGHKFGGQGGVKEADTGKTIGYYHEPESGKNSLPRTFNHLLSSGYGFDEFFAAHVHNPLVGYANGVAVTIGPSCQGPTDYSNKLPVKASLYGTVVKFSNAAPVEHPANGIIWHAWHFVNDDTLERAEYRKDGLDRLLESLACKKKDKK